MLISILPYYSILLTSLVVIILSGILITKTFNINYPKSATSTFINVFFGLTTLVVIYSIVLTSGFTINLGFILLAIFYFIYNYFIKEKRIELNSDSNIDNFKYSIYLEILVISSILFAIQCFTVVNLESSFFYTPSDPDRVLYADFINWLNNTGQETTRIDYQTPGEIGLRPYNYYHLWISSALSKLFTSNTLLTDHLVASPLYAIVVYLGFRAISDSFKVPRLYSIFGSFIAVVLCFEIQIPLLDKITFLGRTVTYFQVTVLEMNKLFAVYLFQIAAIIFYVNKKIIASLFTLSAMAIAIIMMAPPILLTCGLMLIFGYYKKIISKAEFIFGFSVLFLLALFILLFYWAFGADTTLVYINEYEGITEVIINSFLSITSINIVIGVTLQILYMLLPYILITIWMRHYFITCFKSTTIAPSMLLCIVIGSLTSLGCWVVLNYHHEAHQMFERYAHVGINLLAFLIIMLAYGKSKWIAWIVIIVILLHKLDYTYEGLTNVRIESKNRYSNEFIIDTQNALQNVNPFGAYIYSESDLDAPRFSTPIMGHFYSTYNSNLYSTNLSDFGEGLSDSYLESIFRQREKQYHPFYKFINKQVLNNNFLNINKSQYDFVIKHNIEYLIVSPSIEIPSIFNNIILQSFRDVNSGEKLYILNNKQ